MKGLKLYEDVFTDSELCKLNDFVNELRAAGQNGELSGDLKPSYPSDFCSDFFLTLCDFCNQTIFHQDQDLR